MSNERRSKNKKAVGNIYFPESFAEGMRVPIVIVVIMTDFPQALLLAIKEILPEVLSSDIQFQISCTAVSSRMKAFNVMTHFSARNNFEVRSVVEKVLTHLFDIHGILLKKIPCPLVDNVIATSNQQVERSIRAGQQTFTNASEANRLAALAVITNSKVSEIAQQGSRGIGGRLGFYKRCIVPKAQEILKRHEGHTSSTKNKIAIEQRVSGLVPVTAEIIKFRKHHLNDAKRHAIQLVAGIPDEDKE